MQPAAAVRIRFATNDPTPWPPELPAGENPPAGAIIDYYLPSSAGDVRLEILDAQERVVRTYTHKEEQTPDPASDAAAYNKVCQHNPGATDCGLALSWPAPRQVLATSEGMHRFTWDMHYDVIPGVGGNGRFGGGGAGGNDPVPHRTYPSVNSPWAPPGAYTARLTVDGRTLTQPLTLKMDPRVKVTPEVQQIFTLTQQLQTATQESVALIEKLKSTSTDPALLKQLTDLPGQLNTAVMSIQASEMPPTATQLEACKKAYANYTNLVAKLGAQPK